MLLFTVTDKSIHSQDQMQQLHQCIKYVYDFVDVAAPEVLPRQEVEESPQAVKRKHTDELIQVVEQEYGEEEAPQTVTRKF